MYTLTQAVADLQAGRTTSRALIERSLAAIADPAGEGARAFIAVYAEQAREGADAMDLLRRHGRAPGAYAGLPFSIKDLFDMAGEVTAALAQRVLPRAGLDALSERLGAARAEACGALDATALRFLDSIRFAVPADGGWL